MEAVCEVPSAMLLTIKHNASPHMTHNLNSWYPPLIAPRVVAYIIIPMPRSFEVIAPNPKP